MRYEYLILPPAPDPLAVRIATRLRVVFRHPGRALILGLLILLAATQLNAQQLPGAASTRAELKARIRAAGDRVIIGLRPDPNTPGMTSPGNSSVSETAAQAIARNLERKGLRLRGRVTIIPAVYGEVAQADLDALLDDPNVEYIEADEPMPLAVLASGRTFRYAEETPWGVPRVTAPDAWALGGSAAYGAGVKVAYLDSGGDWSHPDLSYAGGYNAMRNSTAAADWNDDIGSCGGHGTHVAGTIAARHNDVGVVGVAPEVSLYAIKVFQDMSGSCLAYQSDQISGLNWAVNNGIKVVSISIGGSTANTSYQSAITSATSKGVYVVAAAGNNGTSTLTYPGAYTDVLSVGALDSGNNKTGYSNYGPKLYIAAPGDGILSTLPGGYGYKSGTSMATPHVAGVVALLLARYPGISRSDLLNRLQQGALDLGAAGRDDYYGWGLARARESMDAAITPLPQPLALGVSPVQHRDTVTTGAATGHPDSAGVSLSGDNSSSTSWTASARRSWTVLSSAAGTGSGMLRWSRNPSGLPAGVYVDTITVVAGGLSSRVFDSLRVSDAAVLLPLSVAVDPHSRYKSVKAGTTASSSDTAGVSFSGAGAALAAWSATNLRPWVTLTVAGGTGTAAVKWSRNPSGLSAGIYVDTITVVAAGALNSPSIVIDSLVVTASVAKGRKSKTVSTGASVDQGESVVSDSAYVEATPGMTWAVTRVAPWMQLLAASGQGAGWITWRRNLSVVGYGVSEDSLEVTTGEGADREVLLTVVETVVSGGDDVAPLAAASALFGSASITTLQARMLDLLGNSNGRYDVGDFLAYHDRTGSTPGAAMMARIIALPVPGTAKP